MISHPAFTPPDKPPKILSVSLSSPKTDRVTVRWAMPQSLDVDGKYGGDPVSTRQYLILITASPGDVAQNSTVVSKIWSDSSSLEYIATGLIPNTRYSVTVAAINAAGTGEPSDAQDTTTQALSPFTAAASPLSKLFIVQQSLI